MKSIEQIKQEYSAKAIEAMNARDASLLSRIRELRQPEGDPYLLERLDDVQRRQLLAEQKRQRADEDRQRLVRKLRSAHEAYARGFANTIPRAASKACEGGGKAVEHDLQRY